MGGTAAARGVTACMHTIFIDSEFRERMAVEIYLAGRADKIEFGSE